MTLTKPLGKKLYRAPKTCQENSQRIFPSDNIAARTAARTAMITLTLASLSPEELRFCRKLMQDAADHTSDEKHRAEALSALETIDARMAEKARQV